MSDVNLERLEERAWRESFSDGLIDLYFGLSLVWIGAAWLWFESIAALAPILPAALAPVLIPLRARIIEPRFGYVRWTAPRRGWERHQLLGLLGLGIGALLLVALVVVAGGPDVTDSWALEAGLLAVLVLIPVVALAVVTGIHRLWVYAAVLLIGAVLVVMVDAEPGWPLLAAGVVATAIGAVLFARFLRAYPAREAA
jgi:hypothetical protein